ncbi:structural protein [Cellulophaga phage phi10:1]|uniref:Structural protein n=1 Tax=Cellulophaga phage phi10:1 TaxID=1327981 RepID=S0A1R5_9CAUD|nr:structural protein [Cellulophaga phage phi10:1]AGO48427.1 structural protein [Cellulophaga phage phi10:1]
MAELSVQLSADIKDLEAALKKAKTQLSGLEKSSKNTNESLRRSSESGAKGVDKLGKATANAAPTLQEFSRVIQDAPFGIVGVGNNITQLVSQFGYLSKSAGGTKAAFSALLGSLTGAGGILFAVSTIVTLLTVFGDKLKFAASSTEKLAKASAEFVSSAQSEISTLQTLVKIANDETVSKTARGRAIERLNEKYGDYLGNLDQESIKTTTVKNAVDNLTRSLLKQAQVRGVQALIEEKYKDTAQDLVTLQLEQKEAYKAVKQEVTSLTKEVDAFSRTSSDNGLVEQIKEIYKIAGSEGGRLNVLTALVNSYSAAKKATGEFVKETSDELKPFQDLLSSLTIEDLLLDTKALDNGITLVGEKIKKGTEKWKNNFVDLGEIFQVGDATNKIQESVDVIFGGIQTGLNNTVARAKPQFDKLTLLFATFSENVKAIGNDAITNGIANIGTAIGEALVSGENVFGAIGQSILASFGDFLSSFGKQLVQYGVAALAFSTISKALANPLTAAPAAIAAIAIGVALSAAGAALSKVAAGGTGSTSSSTSTSSVAGQSSYSSASSSSSYGSSVSGGSDVVVFEISGTKLIGVLDRTLKRNSRLGGNLTIG